MVIPVGKRYTATLKGAVWKPVTCEQCGCQFAYQITVSAKGTGRSMLFLNNDGARSTAQAGAVDNFRAKAADAIGSVPCPDCGKYQGAMVHKMRMDLLGVAGGVLIGMGVASVILVRPEALERANLMGILFVGVAVYWGFMFLPLLTGAALASLIATGLLGFALKGVVGYYPASMVVLFAGLIAAGVLAFTAYRRSETPAKSKVVTRFRKKYPVMRRSEFEVVAEAYKETTGKPLVMPNWSGR